MKVLVTGGAGYVGYSLVGALVDDPQVDELIVLDNLSRGQYALFSGGRSRRPVRFVEADILDGRSLARAMRGVDTVVHLAGRATMEPLSSIRPTLVDGTRALAEAAADAGVTHLVHASSLLVHGEARAAAPIDAATPVDPQVDYGRAKVLAERALAAVEDAGGPTVAALRLPHVYGAGDLLFGRVRRGLLVTPGAGDNLYAHMHVEDAARLVVAAATERWRGATAVADDEPATWRRFWSIATAHFAGFRHIQVPTPLARAGATVAAALDPRRGPSMVTRDTVVGYNLDQPVAAGLVWDDLGLRPRYPTVEVGVPAVLDSTIQYRWQHPVDDRLS